jgi:hypothetical protein
MFNKALMASFAILILSLSIPISGAYLEMDVAENEKTVYLGDDVSFLFTITNSRALSDRIGLEVSGEPVEWIESPPTNVFVQGQGGEADVSVNFFPSGESTGKFQYTVTVLPNRPSVETASDSETVTLNVIRPLDIEEFSVTKSGNELIMNILLNSKDSRDAEMSFVMINSRGEFLRRFSLEATVDGPTLIVENVPLEEDMLAGDYDVIVSLAGTPVETECMFTVMPIHRVTEYVEKTSTPLYDDFKVTIVNEGNIKETEYVSYQVVPSNDWVTGFVTEPTGCSTGANGKTCRYSFQDLDPGEVVTLEYRLDYTPVYAGYGILLVTIFLVVMITMRRATAPVIIKRHVRKSGGKHHVVLEIKNPFYHNLSNTIVRDWVSPLANVLHNEITMLRPLIRRSDAGTELIWKLGDIKPRETRIITYPLKALLKGSLKMPRAYIRYNKPNGKLKRIFSRGIVIEA